MKKTLSKLLARKKPFIIAEVGQAHDGSLGMAHSFIDAVSASGADAIKFQTHIALAESTLEEPWRVKFSPQDTTRFAYWKRMEFTLEQWHGLVSHAKDNGLEFLSSTFSPEGVDLLRRVGVRLWKVPSGEIENPLLLGEIWKTKLPVIYSTGMSNSSEIDKIVQTSKERGIEFALLQCTSEYPCSPERWGLAYLSEMKHKYDCPVGLSDHSGTVFASFAAATLGADLIEVHVTMSRYSFGPDVSASVTMEELAEICRGSRTIRKSIDAKATKDSLSTDLRRMKTIFGKSLALRTDLPKGTILTDRDITLKKPGTGLPLAAIGKLIGKKLRKDKSSQKLLFEDDVS